MADKSLKISVKSDLREGQKLTRFVQDLQQRVEKFAKTLGNINIGGMGPNGQPRPGQQGGLSKQLETDKRAMEAMGRETENLNRRLQALNQTVGQLQQKMGGGPPTNAAGGLLYGPNGQPLPPSGGPAAPGGPGAPPAPPGGGGGGGGPPWWRRPVNFGKGPLGQMLGPLAGPGAWLAVANALKNTILGAPQREIDWAALSGKQQAYGGQADFGEFGARVLRGDVMPLIGAWRAAGNGSSWQLSGDMKTLAQEGQAAARNKAIGGVASLSGIGRLISDPTKTTSDMLMGLTDREEASQMLRQSAAQVKAGERANLVQNEFIQYGLQQAPMRTAFSRRYGADFSAGTALGMNVDPQQVAPVVGAVLDVLGQGHSVAKMTKVVSEGLRMGLSNEAMQAMMRSTELGGGNLYERILRSGMSRPMMSRAGTAAANFAMGGLVAGRSDMVAGAFTYGGARNDEFTMKRREAGLEGLSAITTGSLDQYQSTVNTALAVRQGGSVYTAGLMAKMSPRDLLRIWREGPTAQEAASGMTREKARDLLKSEVNSVGNRLVNEGGNNTAGARAVMGAKGDIWGAISTGKNLPALSAGINQALGLDPNTEIAQAIYGIQSGGPSGARGRAHGGAYEGAQAFNLGGARYMEGKQVDLREALTVIGAAAKSMDTFIQRMQSTQAGANDPDVAKRAIAGLGVMGDQIQKIATNSQQAIAAMQAFSDLIDKFLGVSRPGSVDPAAAARAFSGYHPKSKFSGGGAHDATR